MELKKKISVNKKNQIIKLIISILSPKFYLKTKKEKEVLNFENMLEYYIKNSYLIKELNLELLIFLIKNCFFFEIIEDIDLIISFLNILLNNKSNKDLLISIFQLFYNLLNSNEKLRKNIISVLNEKKIIINNLLNILKNNIYIDLLVWNILCLTKINEYSENLQVFIIFESEILIILKDLLKNNVISFKLYLYIIEFIYILSLSTQNIDLIFNEIFQDIFDIIYSNFFDFIDDGYFKIIFSFLKYCLLIIKNHNIRYIFQKQVFFNKLFLPFFKLDYINNKKIDQIFFNLLSKIFQDNAKVVFFFNKNILYFIYNKLSFYKNCNIFIVLKILLILCYLIDHNPFIEIHMNNIELFNTILEKFSQNKLIITRVNYLLKKLKEPENN